VRAMPATRARCTEMGRSWQKAAFVALLTASVAGNIVLYRAAARTADAERSVARPPVGSRSPVLTPVAAITPHTATSEVESCRQHVAEISANLAEMKRQLEKFELPGDVFHRDARDSARNGARESDLRRHLLRSDAGGDFLPDIECHGLICRLSRDTETSTGSLLDPEWVRRNVKATQVMRSEFYYRLHEPGDRPSGDDILKRFVEDFERAGAVDHCMRRYREDGVPEVRLLLLNDDEESESDPSGLSFRLRGPLAATQLGKCIGDELRAALERIQLPERYQSALLNVRFKSGT